MNGGSSGCRGVILYNTEKQGENAVYGYYEGDKITIKKGKYHDLLDEKTKIEKGVKRKDKLSNKIFVRLALVIIALIIATFMLTSFIKALFLSLVFVAAFVPVLGLFYANINRYEENEDYQQFRRYHGCEHACLEMISKEKELTMENLRSSDIYNAECGSVYMGYFLTLLVVLAVVILNFGAIGFIKALITIVVTIVLLFLNIFNPYNPYKLLQKNVVSKPTEKEYNLALELLKEFREL